MHFTFKNKHNIYVIKNTVDCKYIFNLNITYSNLKRQISVTTMNFNQNSITRIHANLETHMKKLRITKIQNLIN